MRKLALSALVALLVVAALPVAAAPAFPEVIPLPNDFGAEGVTVGRGGTFYAGSLNDGSVFAGDLSTGEGSILVGAQEGRMAVGLDVDDRSNVLFVAGGLFGSGYFYDAETGADLGSVQFTSGPSFVNDVIVTRQAAYFTDSFRPVVYRVPLGPAGQLGAGFDEITLSGDFGFVPGDFNGNGIAASADGTTLIVVNTALATLYRVDPETGHADAIDLGGDSVPNGDGLVLEGKTLYVVQNFLNQIGVVELDPGFASGEFTGAITSPNFRIPTTADVFGGSLYAVNARFDVAPPGGGASGIEFEIVKADKN